MCVEVSLSDERLVEIARETLARTDFTSRTGHGICRLLIKLWDGRAAMREELASHRAEIDRLRASHG